MIRSGFRLTILVLLSIFLLIPLSCRTWSSREERAAQAYNDGNSLREAGLLNEALESYTLALEQEPAMAAAAFNSALTLVDLGRSDEALKILQDLNNRDPRNLSVLRAMGWAAWEGGSPDSSLNYYKAVLVIFPADKKALQAASEVYETSGRPEMAVEMRQFLVSLDDNSETRNNLAAVLEQSGRYTEAFEVYQGVLVREPKNQIALEGAAGMADINGDFAKSIVYRLKQIESGYQVAESWWHIARIRLTETGDYEKGLEALGNSLENGFNNDRDLDLLLSNSPPLIRPAVQSLLTETRTETPED